MVNVDILQQLVEMHASRKLQFSVNLSISEDSLGSDLHKIDSKKWFDIFLKVLHKFNWMWQNKIHSLDIIRGYKIRLFVTN